jgi:hypothetical protein
MSVHVLLPPAVNSEPEQKVNPLPLLGFESATFDMLAHLSDRPAKSYPGGYFVLTKLYYSSHIYTHTAMEKIQDLKNCTTFFVIMIFYSDKIAIHLFFFVEHGQDQI